MTFLSMPEEEGHRAAEHFLAGYGKNLGHCSIIDVRARLAQV